MSDALVPGIFWAPPASTRGARRAMCIVRMMVRRPNLRACNSPRANASYIDVRPTPAVFAASVPLANCIFNRADPHSWRGRMIFGKPCRERFRFALQHSFIALVMDARLIFSNDELLRCRSSRRPGKIDLLTRSRFRRKVGISRGDRSDNSRRRHQFAEPFRQ